MRMRLAHHLLRHPSGTWHFRLIVPKSLRPILGLSVIKRSLGTKDPAVARAWAYALGARCAQMLASARDAVEAGMSKWDDDAVARAMGQIQKNSGGGSVRPWEIETPDGFKVRTDGSDKDHRQGLEALQAMLDARPYVPPSTDRWVAPTPTSTSRLTLADAIKGYSEVEALAMRPNTWSQRKRALDDFCKAIGPFAFVAQITRQKASTWSDGLLRSGKSNVYVANCVSHVAQLFESLLRKEIVTSNPVKGLVVVKKSEKAKRRAQGHEWEPFEVETLKKIFDPANLKKVKEHVSWGALLGLYTGGRVGEIAQIFLRDFVVEGGVPCLKICADSDGQSIKTGFGGERLVPIHPDLIELGLLDRVGRLRAEGHERLFPRMRIDSAAGRGNSISKGFNYYLTGLGIKPRRAHGIIGIHSLRKTVIQTLQGSSLPAERRRALVGHEAGDPVADTHQGSYMRPWTAAELASFFPELPWGKWLATGDLKSLLTRIKV
ncbi:site-specific integrase [Luteibacter sp. PPL554]